METEMWYKNPEVWITVAFVLFIALTVKYLLPMITKGLDNRALTIREQLEQASRLRLEAEALLASYRAEHEAKAKEAEDILAAAKASAEALRTRAEAELKQAIDRRSQQAVEKIARAEQEATAAIRTQMIETATQAAANIIRTQLETAGQEDAAVAQALQAIERQIH